MGDELDELMIPDAVDSGDKARFQEKFGFGEPVMRIACEQDGDYCGTLISVDQAKTLIAFLSKFVVRHDP